MSLQQLWNNKIFQLIFGATGIYACYWTAGIYQQKILRQPYGENDATEMFGCPSTLLWSSCGFAWLFGYILNSFMYKKHTYIPASNLIACACIVNLSTLTYSIAIYITNFPIVMMVKSCNIVSVVMVGVCCSGVRDKSLQLGAKKIIVASFITAGILLYNFGGDAENKDKASSLIGVFLLVVSLVVDGFLPDFQAIIKAEYKPQPSEMFEHINKWVFILSIVYSVITGKLFETISFGIQKPTLFRDLFINSFLSTIGQLFVYKMIKEFKQHIVPFVITTRKIFTVVISIFLYGHETKALQFLGIGIVACAACYEYLSQLCADKTQEGYKQPVQLQKSNTSMLSDTITSDDVQAGNLKQEQH